MRVGKCLAKRSCFVMYVCCKYIWMVNLKPMKREELGMDGPKEVVGLAVLVALS